MLVMPWDDQYWLRYQVDQQVTTIALYIKLPISQNHHNQCFDFRLSRSSLYNEPKMISRQLILVEI